MTTAETQLAERNSNNRLRGARAEVRTDTVHKKQYEAYRPLGAQDVPPALKQKLEAEGWYLHWVRMTEDGVVDHKNIADITHKGYVPVDISDIPENLVRTMNIGDVAGFKGLIISTDTALFKIEKDRYEEIRKYYRDIADRQMQGVHDQIKQNASIHGLEVKLYDESISKVSIGEKSRQVVAQDDASSDNNDE